MGAVALPCPQSVAELAALRLPGASPKCGRALVTVSVAANQPLLGRESELQLLLGKVHEIEARGGAFGLVGDAGVGKSALLAEVLAHAESLGVTVRTARGSQAESGFPFGGLHQLLRPLLPSADRLPVKQREALLACFAMSDFTDSNPFLTSLAVLELVAESARSAPILLAVDDLHWMDQASIDTLGFIARRITHEPVILLCTSRPRPVSLSDHDAVEWIELTGISPDASAALLDAKRHPAAGCRQPPRSP